MHVLALYQQQVQIFAMNKVWLICANCVYDKYCAIFLITHTDTHTHMYIHTQHTNVSIVFHSQSAATFS